jgi:D-amino-acid oxidase
MTDARVLDWAEESRRYLGKLSVDWRSGVRLVHGLEAARTGVPPPDWARALPDFRAASDRELPAGFVTGWWYTAPVVDMPIYLRYLHDRLIDSGGAVDQREIVSLRPTPGAANLVINCTGVGARDLVPDPGLTPTRGQILVARNPGITEFFAEHDESELPVYVLPQGPHRVVLGGSIEPGRTDTTPDPVISAAIHHRCTAVIPRLRHAPILEVRTGLRPTRPRIRVERTTEATTTVIHNYGHGGVTLSWGCAREVLHLARDT